MRLTANSHNTKTPSSPLHQTQHSSFQRNQFLEWTLRKSLMLVKNNNKALVVKMSSIFCCLHYIVTSRALLGNFQGIFRRPTSTWRKMSSNMSARLQLPGVIEYLHFTALGTFKTNNQGFLSWLSSCKTHWDLVGTIKISVVSGALFHPAS